MKRIALCLMPFIVCSLFLACNNVFPGPEKSAGGNVIIKIAGEDGRTILPKNPVFNKFDLSLQKEGGSEILKPDTAGIDGAGVEVTLSPGTWTITLKAYQDILQDGIGILAAEGCAALAVAANDGVKTVLIEMLPLPIENSAEKGLFSFDIALPGGLDTAVLVLKDISGAPVEGFDSLDLLAGNTGSKDLAPGYYDLAVILTKNGQSAGIFEAVHIYSGLESPAVIDLSGIVFDDKVYLAGTLGGIRLGTIKITTDAAGESVIKTFDLDGSKAERSAGWITDIPSAYLGTVYAVLEFNGEREIVPVTGLEANGRDGIALDLIPVNALAVNAAPWYSVVSGGDNPERAVDGNLGTYRDASSGGLILDFGFNVTVDSSRIIFYSESGTVDLDGYLVEYWDGAAWQTLARRTQAFSGSTDASVKYGDFFAQISASKFRWTPEGGTAALVEFGLYKAADRTALSGAIAAAEEHIDSVPVSVNGAEYLQTEKWVTAEAQAEYRNAIAAAQDACNDPALSQAALAAAKTALDDASAAFNDAQAWGTFMADGLVAYTFTGPADETITLTGSQALSWIENTELFVEAAETFDSYQWYVDGAIKAGETGPSISLNARSFSVGTHTLTLMVMQNGIPYTKTLYFTVY